MTITLPLIRRHHFLTARCHRILCRDRTFHTAHLRVMLAPRTS